MLFRSVELGVLHAVDLDCLTATTLSAAPRRSSARQCSIPLNCAKSHFYNSGRPHSSMDEKTPDEFCFIAANVAKQNSSGVFLSIEE